MGRQFARGRGRLGSKRETTWRPIPLVAFAVSTSGTLIASLDAEELAKRPFTIIRVHLAARFVSDQNIASEEFQVGVGMCVVSDQALAIGITAVPTPLTDLGSDLWLLHQLVFSGITFDTAAGTQSPDGAPTAYIDSKAMRKINDDQDLVLTVERDNALGDGATVIIGGRALIKEH